MIDYYFCAILDDHIMASPFIICHHSGWLTVHRFYNRNDYSWERRWDWKVQWLRKKQSLFWQKSERVRKVKKMSHFDQTIAYSAPLRIISEKGQKTPSNELSEYEKRHRIIALLKNSFTVDRVRTWAMFLNKVWSVGGKWNTHGSW